jgi:hypothetical protein
MASKLLVDEISPQSHATDVTLTTGKKIAGANTQFKITGGSNTNVLTTDGSGGLTWGEAANTTKVAYLVDEKTSGTNGGTFTNGAWQHRDLQTEYYDTIGVSFGTNTFILPVGTFYIDWTCPAAVVNQHRSRLYNITSAAVVKYGTSAYSNPVHDWSGYNDAEISTTSCGSALVTLVATATLKVEHRCVTTVSTFGMGKASSLAEEIYTTVKIMQIS